MTSTQADLDNLNAAIDQGVRQATIGDVSTTFATTAALIQARDDLARRLAVASQKLTGRRRPRQTLLQQGGRGY